MTIQTIDLAGNTTVKSFIVAVSFLHALPTAEYRSHKQYDFYCDKIVNLNDVVVVDTINGFHLAKIVGFKQLADYKGKLKWVVDKVDTAGYEQRIYKEQKQAELLAAMKKKASQMDELARFQLLAQTDPDMAALLAAYQGIQTPDESIATLVWESNSISGDPVITDSPAEIGSDKE